jgi:transcriptional regulator with XRE-family HTH domain
MKNITGPLKKAMSERFIILRSKMGLTQEDFSKKLGILRFIISDIENQRQLPTIPVIINLMNTLNISPLWLLKGEGEIYIKGKEPELSKLDHFKKTFPDVPAEAEVFELIDSLSVPILKNALILKFFELKDNYKSQIEEYQKEKAQALSAKK